MKNLFLTLLLIPMLATAEPSTQGVWKLPIDHVIDGDTIATTIPQLPYPLGLYKIRVYGIDTPEKGGRAQCPKEAAMGEKATQLTKKLAAGQKTMNLHHCFHDKYGGRFVCDVEIAGKSVGNELINAGLAREYYGDKKKSWCE